MISQPLSAAIIEQILGEDLKGPSLPRFELNEARTHIRAVHGHSLANIDPSLVYEEIKDTPSEDPIERDLNAAEEFRADPRWADGTPSAPGDALVAPDYLVIEVNKKDILSNWLRPSSKPLGGVIDANDGLLFPRRGNRFIDMYPAWTNKPRRCHKIGRAHV